MSWMRLATTLIGSGFTIVEFDERVSEFLDRPLTSEWPYVWLDATYLKQRQGGRIMSVAAIIAVAVNTEGRRSGAHTPASFRSSICASFASG